MYRRKGFTLIELLVVISIIALLMAILIPALRAAKAAAAGSVCLSNQHNLAMAWYTYTIENDDKLVGGDVLEEGSYTKARSGEQWVDPPIDEDGKYAATSTDCYIEHELEGLRRGALFPYVRDVEVYHCPADKRFRRRPTTLGHPKQDGGYRSYSIADGLNGEIPPRSYMCMIYGQIKNPASVYVFVEEKDSRSFNRGSWALGSVDNTTTHWAWVDPGATWHNKKSTLGWADGHASMRRWVEKITVEGFLEEDWDNWKDNIRGSQKQKGNRDLIYMKEHFGHLGIMK